MGVETLISVFMTIVLSHVNALYSTVDVSAHDTGNASIVVRETQEMPSGTITYVGGEDTQAVPSDVTTYMDGDSADAVPSEPVAYIAGEANEYDAGDYGDFGRLYIGDFSVALWAIEEQWLVDEENAAAVYFRDGSLVIGDHANQGFDVIKDLSLGDACEIKHADGSVGVYVCKEIDYNCHNTGYDLVRSDWTTLCSGYSDIVMYTCNESWQDVTCVWFDKV